MKQKIEDLKLLIKNDRRILAGAAFFIVVVLIVTVAGGDKPKRSRLSVTKGSTEQVMSVDEGYRDLMLAYRKDIENLAKSAKQQQDVLSRVNTEFTQHKQKTAGIFETLVDRVEDISKELDVISEKINQPQSSQQIDQYGLAVEEPAGEAIQTFGFSEATVAPPPEAPRAIRASVISPGDVVSILLITGVNAPVDGTPYPVLFKLNGPISGPDGSSLDLGEGRLLAAAQGSESDGRVLFRLQELALRHSDGRRSVVKVDGWVVGEDGIRGMKGRLVDKLGRLILATMGVSFTAALGNRIDNKASAISIDNSQGVRINADDLEFSYASALTDASNRLGQILLDRYEKLVPVVEVLSGREVAAVFSQTAEIEILDDDYFDDGYLTSSLN